MANRRSAFGMFIGWVAGVLILLLLYALVNWLVPKVLGGFALELLDFLNGALVLILAASFAFFLGDFFSSFRFPFNLPSPVPRAIGAVLLLYFAALLMKLIDDNVSADFYQYLRPVCLVSYALAFLAVLAIGYLIILLRLIGGRRKRQYVNEVIDV